MFYQRVMQDALLQQPESVQFHRDTSVNVSSADSVESNPRRPTHSGTAGHLTGQWSLTPSDTDHTPTQCPADQPVNRLIRLILLLKPNTYHHFLLE